MKNVKQLLAVLACAAFLGGCAGATIESSDINNQVQAALKADAEVGSFNLKSTTDYGHVTLSGTVNNQWQQFKAGDIAKKVPGVRTVKNKVKIAD